MGPMSTPQTPQQIRHEYTDDFKQHYANSVQIKISLWDAELVFGLLQTPMVPGEEVTILNWGSVHISPQQAKALAQLLDSHVRMYEQNFGPISLKAWTPPDTLGRKQ